MRKTLLLIACVAAAACGGSSTQPTGSLTQAAPPATVAVAADAKYGKHLVDGSGRALYLFEQDRGTSSTCDGDCARYWPPFLTSGPPKAGDGVAAALLGTTRRGDGTLEVTYAGHPLYYVVTDHNPGDTTGQGVDNYGAPWDLVGPDGSSIG